MVFDTIISPAFKFATNSSPFIPVPIVKIKQDLLLFVSPLDGFDGRIKLIVPSLSALLSRSSENIEVKLHSSRDVVPFLDPPDLNNLQQCRIFILTPCSPFSHISYLHL